MSVTIDGCVRRRGAQHLGRHVEHRVAAVLARDLKNRLSGLHDFARLGVPGGDRAGHGRLQFGKADPVLGLVKLGAGVVDPGLRGLAPLPRLIVIDPGREPAFHQMGLTIEVVARLQQLTFGGGQRGCRRAQRVQFVHRIERRQHLVGFDPVADVGEPLQDSSADAKRERHFVLRENLSGQSDRFADVAFGRRDRAHGTRRSRFGDLLFPARAEHQSDRGKKRQSPRETAAPGRISLAQGHRGPWN